MNELTEQMQNEPDVLYYESAMLRTRRMEAPAVIAFFDNELQIFPAIGKEIVIPMEDIEILYDAPPLGSYGKHAWRGKEIVRFKNMMNNEIYGLGVKDKQQIIRFLDGKIHRK